MKWVVQVFLMEFRKLITYRADFWINFFGLTLFSVLISYFLWKSIFHYTQNSEMSGFTLPAMVFYYLMTPLIYRIQQGQRIGFISKEIYEGGLNKYLLYPINFYLYKIATYFAHAGFYLIQLFLILLIHSIFFYNTEVFSFSFVNMAIFVIFMFIATLNFFYLSTLYELLAFWFDNIWSLGVLIRFVCGFLGGYLIPLAFFPEWAQSVLAYTPFPYLVHIPFQVLTGNIAGSQILFNLGLSIFWLIIFRFLSIKVWQKGKYQYSGVGI